MWGCVSFCFQWDYESTSGLKTPKKLNTNPMTKLKRKLGMSVFLASADPFLFGSSTAMRSRYGSQLSCLQFNVSILVFVRKTWKCYVLIMEGVM